MALLTSNNSLMSYQLHLSLQSFDESLALLTSNNSFDVNSNNGLALLNSSNSFDVNSNNDFINYFDDDYSAQAITIPNPDGM